MKMIAWSGRGFLSIVVLFVSVLLMGVILPKEQIDLAIAVGFLITAVFSWFMGKKWNAAKGRVVIDKASGQEVEIRQSHSIFWIKMQYWGIIFGLIGIFLLTQLFV